jgi:hypothetical protein
MRHAKVCTLGYVFRGEYAKSFNIALTYCDLVG